MKTSKEKLAFPSDSVQGVLEFLPHPFLIGELRDGIVCVRYINPPFLKEIGYTIEEIPTIHDWFRIAYPDPEYRKDRETHWFNEVNRAREQKENFVVSIAHIKTKNQGFKWYEVKASVFAKGFEFVSFVNMDEVITREAQLVRANENKNKMLSILSHDLRNAISNLHSIAGLALSSKLTREEFVAAITKLKEKAYHTIGLLDTTVHWTKANFDVVKPNCVPLNLNSILFSITQTEDIFKTKRIDLITELDDQLNPASDPEIMTVILRNLISNAVKFTPPGGKIKITSTQKNNQFIISVANTGKGMSEDRIQSILNKQYSPSKGTLDEHGLGIGLSLCLDLLYKINGRLEIESKLNVGTEMKVILEIGNQS